MDGVKPGDRDIETAVSPSPERQQARSEQAIMATEEGGSAIGDQNETLGGDLQKQVRESVIGSKFFPTYSYETRLNATNMCNCSPSYNKKRTQ